MFANAKLCRRLESDGLGPNLFLLLCESRNLGTGFAVPAR